MTEFVCSTSNKFFPRVRGTLEERFFSKVSPEPNSGCWLWGGDDNGHYGAMGVKIGRKFKRKLAHRISWEIHRGEIAPGYAVDHLCRNKFCVNPDHLEVVTPRENVTRALIANGGSFHNPRRKTCRKGHDIEHSVTVFYRGKAYRKCVICAKAAQTAASERRRLSAADGRARKSLTLKQKLHVLAQQARCPECGELLGVLSSIQYDHRHQLAMGGPDTLENIRAVHIDCHAKKTKRDAKARAKVRHITGKKSARFSGPPRGEDIGSDADADHAGVRNGRRYQWPKRKMQSRGFAKGARA